MRPGPPSPSGLSPTPRSAPPETAAYALLDSGDGTKLERFGAVVLQRPSPQSLWARRRPASEWVRADAEYVRSSTGGGHWRTLRTLPASWEIDWEELHFRVQPTGFGHVGLFPEQAPFWRWLRAVCAADPDAASTGTATAAAPLEVLNLFAYTGGSSMAAAAGGAMVTHCDASRGIVTWAKENAQRSQIPTDRIRWIVDDASKFVRREERRGRTYAGLILDPPSFGRGAKGEVFKLEEHLPALLASCGRLLAPQARFALLSAHTPGVGPLALRHLLEDVVRGRGGALACGEMWIPESPAGRALPSGTWAAWACDGRLPVVEATA